MDTPYIACGFFTVPQTESIVQKIAPVVAGAAGLCQKPRLVGRMVLPTITQFLEKAQAPMTGEVCPSTWTVGRMVFWPSSEVTH